jgi:hypothetical protein
MALKVEVRDPKSLSANEIDELFALFCSAFQADKSGFEQDLAEKHKVLIVRSEEALLAFTSLRLFRPEPAVRVYFSGDTFASPQARLGHRLPSLWARYVFGQLAPEEGVKDYWLLFCSGYRTYRILPTCFERYVPGPTDESELEQLRDRWAKRIFGERYSSGIVRPRWATPLIQPEPPERLKDDSNVQLFLRQNPGYQAGDELVCLIPLEESNLSSAGRRLVGVGVS